MLLRKDDRSSAKSSCEQLSANGDLRCESRPADLPALPSGCSTFKVLTLQAGQTLVPAQADRVIESLRPASDALYVLVRQGVYSHLLRVKPGTNSVDG
jgi:hypothetical protein